MKKRILSELNIVFPFLLFISLLVSSCDEGFAPPYHLEKIKILGVKLDNPEICVMGKTVCPKDAYKDNLKVSLLAADDNEVVADGIFPDGAFLNPGYDLKWALCNYSLRGNSPIEPDCTLDSGNLLPDKKENALIPTPVILKIFNQLFSPDLGKTTETKEGPITGFSGFGESSVEQVLALSLSTDKENYIWGNKKFTISMKENAKLNKNPHLQEISLDKLPLKYSKTPSIELMTGYSYKITWKYPESDVEEYDITGLDGIKKQKERFNLAFYASHGSFNKSGEIEIWLGDEKESELYWRSPLEIPAEGLIVTFVFKLNDGRGGCDWRWGKAKIIRGDGIMPRF